MKRVRFAEGAEVGPSGDVGRAPDPDERPRSPAPPSSACPFGGTAWCDDVLSAEVPPSKTTAETATAQLRMKGAASAAVPIEPFNLASERAAGVVDAGGNVVPFDERLLLPPRERRRLQREALQRKGGEDGDAWIDDLERRQREDGEGRDDDDVAGTIDGVPSRRCRRDGALPRPSTSSSEEDERSEGSGDDESDDGADLCRPLAEAAPLSGAELRALKLRLARLLRPEESVLQALRRLAAPPGIAGSPGNGGLGLLLSSSEAAAASAAASAAADALSSSPMFRESIVAPVDAPGRKKEDGSNNRNDPRSISGRGRAVPRENVPLFDEVTDLAAALAAAGDPGVHWRPREALLRGVLGDGGVGASSSPGGASSSSAPSLSGRKRRTEGREERGETGERRGEGDDSSASAAAAAAAAVAAGINAPGLVIDGVQTDYKPVLSPPSPSPSQQQQQQQQQQLYYSSSRGLYLDASSIEARRQLQEQGDANASPPRAPLPPPPRVRCAATGAWKRARPVTDDGGTSGSAL